MAEGEQEAGAAEAAPPARAPGGPGGRGAFDLTKGPITKTLLLFTLPTLASNVLQSLNGSINAVWVGHFLGEAALAATANATIIMFLMFSVVFGLGMAATVVVGQCMGRGDLIGARRAFGSAIGFCFILTLFIAGLGYLFAPQILRLLDTPPTVYPLALDYLRVIFISLPGALITIMLMMGLRGSGDAMTPLRFMVLTVFLDAGFNPFLILGIGPFPQWGIAGSAAASAIANYLSLAAMIAYLYAKDLPLRLRGPELKFLKPDPAEMRIMITRGLPMGFQMIVMSLAMLIVISLVNYEGVEMAAAYGAAQQVWNYVQMPAMAVGAAVSAMAAQNIGAGRWDRVERTTRSGILVNFGMTGGLLALMFAFDRPVLALFLNGSGEAIELARHMQYLASWSFLFFGVSMVLFGTMRANGIVIAPLVMLIVSMFVVRLGFYFGFYDSMGPDALWWGFSLGSLSAMMMAGLYYRFSKWREASMGIPHGAPQVAVSRSR